MVGAILGTRGREPAEIALGAGFGACFLALAWSDVRRHGPPAIKQEAIDTALSTGRVVRLRGGTVFASASA